MQDEVGEVRVIAPLTVAVQDGGKRRLCWNGRPTNVGLDAQPFKMEHVQTVSGQDDATGGPYHDIGLEGRVPPISGHSVVPKVLVFSVGGGGL
jgi:hypothetical protein